MQQQTNPRPLLLEFFNAIHTVRSYTPEPDFFIFILRSQIWKLLIKRLTYLCLIDNHGHPSNKTLCIYMLPDLLNQQYGTRIGTKLFLFYVALIVVLSIL
jgi:hypothetical protein